MFPHPGNSTTRLSFLRWAHPAAATSLERRMRWPGGPSRLSAAGAGRSGRESLRRHLRVVCGGRSRRSQPRARQGDPFVERAARDHRPHSHRVLDAHPPSNRPKRGHGLLVTASSRRRDRNRTCCRPAERSRHRARVGRPGFFDRRLHELRGHAATRLETGGELRFGLQHLPVWSGPQTSIRRGAAADQPATRGAGWKACATPSINARMQSRRRHRTRRSPAVRPGLRARWHEGSRDCSRCGCAGAFAVRARTGGDRAPGS